MKRIAFAIMAAAMLLSSCSEKAKQTALAIVIDPQSYQEAKAEIDQYQATVQSRGLKPILIVDEWGVPDSIRCRLMNLYNDAKCPIEGAVFIGDIPVAMIRDAQHFTSAFKMDQEYPRLQSSIPSDRFYDSFDLGFDYIDKDSARYFYYSLRADCTQLLQPTIYSSRITPRDNERGGKYEKLRRYMQRVNEYAANPKPFERMMIFGGHGNQSNSLAARMDSKYECYDQCPWMRDPKLSVSYMDYTQQENIKPRLLDDLQDPRMDYALLSHHGDATIQYLSSDRNNKMINLETFEFANFHPQVRLVSLDACYNGSFHLDDNIQEAYLFGEGNGTMLVLANSVNSIQDKWVNRYTGLLGLGMRAGYLARFGSFLEFHLFGDPTYQFAKSADCGFDINSAIVSKGDSFWKKQLDNPYPAVQNLALTMLAIGKENNSDAIYDKYLTSNSGMVRLAALMELSKYNDANFHEAIIEGLDDENELTQRFAVLYSGKNGNPDFATPLIELFCQNNLSERVEFDLNVAMRSFDSTLIADKFVQVYPKYDFHTNSDSIRQHLEKVISQNAGVIYFDIREALKSTKASQKSKLVAIRSIRNNPPHFVTDEVLQYLDTIQANPADSLLQKATWEAIGWFNLSYRASDIADHAMKVYENTAFPVSVRNEALKTYNRIHVK